MRFSPSHGTTPQKENDRNLNRYPGYLERQWKSVTGYDDEGIEEEYDVDMVDVLTSGGRSLMRVQCVPEGQDLDKFGETTDDMLLTITKLGELVFIPLVSP